MRLFLNRSKRAHPGSGGNEPASGDKHVTPSNPPKPRLALALGITGHRPNERPDDPQLPEGYIRKISPKDAASKIEPIILRLRDTVKDLYEGEFSSCFSDMAPRLSLVTGLAEGADSIAADIADRAGYLIEPALPFSVEDYRPDFKTEAALQTFDAMLDKARSRSEDAGEISEVLALPGSRDHKSAAYEMAGIAMLDHVSLLLAVWDRQPSRGRGGTEDIVAEATRRRMPIIVIDATDPLAEPTLRWGGLGEYPVYPAHVDDLTAHRIDDALPTVLRSILGPPGESDRETSQNRETRNLMSYFGETLHRRNRKIAWPLLQGFFGVRRPKLEDLRVPDPQALATQISALTGVQSDAMSHAYGWADALATFYAQKFRGAFVANFVFAALAIFSVALSVLLKDALHVTAVKWPFVLAEILCIGIVLYNTISGRRREWHRRWLEAREVAERLRVAMPQRRLATRPQIVPGIPSAWTTWYFRAVLREAGLPDGAIMRDGLQARRQELLDLLENQRAYHATTDKRMHALEKRMELTGEILFGLTLAAAVLFLIMTFATDWPISAEWKYAVTALTAGLPVLATATYGIRVIGDFEGNASRSKRMADELQRLTRAIGSDNPDDLALAQARAREAGEIMLGDIASWRSSAESRGLDLPG